MIKKLGRYLEVDMDGFLIPDVSKQHIPENWQRLIDEIITFVENNAVDSLVSLYLRGSVPRGLAVDHISDLDLIFITKDFEEESSPEIMAFKNELLVRYPFCIGIEWSMEPLPDLAAKPPLSEDRHLANLLKTQSLHLWGQDIAKDFPKVKPGIDMVTHAFRFEKEWREFPKRITSAPDQEKVTRLCRWMGKRILRTAFELVALDRPVFTRDMYLCYETTAEKYPEIGQGLYAVLALSLRHEPTADQVLKTFTPVAEFIIEKIKACPIIDMNSPLSPSS